MWWTRIQNNPKRLARRLAQLKCDVILAKGMAAALAVQAGAPATPKVFVMIGDPVALGIVATLPRPGGHATGFAAQSQEIAVKQLSLLRELAPAAKRVALMFHDGNIKRASQSASAVESVAKRQVLPFAGFRCGRARCRCGASELLREPVDGLMVMFDRITHVHTVGNHRHGEPLRLPTVYGSRYFTDNGGGWFPTASTGRPWCAASADYVGTHPRRRQAGGPAGAAADALRTGRQPARRAHVGLTVPQSVLLQATEVIE